MATVCLSEPRVSECPASLPTTEYVCFSGERMADFRCLGTFVGLWEGEVTQAWVWIAMAMEVDGRCHGSALLLRRSLRYSATCCGISHSKCSALSCRFLLSQLLLEKIPSLYLPFSRPPYAGLRRPIDVPMSHHVPACGRKGLSVGWGKVLIRCLNLMATGQAKRSMR
jgi:hypothetical protein